MTISEKVRKLQTEVQKAEVCLVAVTKTVDPGHIREAYDAGIRDFGENRVQEWMEKRQELPSDIRWHLIGRLQTNKVKYVVGHVHLIHSLDRMDLADAIEQEARKKQAREVSCLLQVNMSGEDTKAGVAPEEASALLTGISKYPSINIRGIMTIGPLTEDEAWIRDCFQKTKKLFEALKEAHSLPAFEVLSMGMSADYKIAITEGSNMIRLGSLIFGERAKVT